MRRILLPLILLGVLACSASAGTVTLTGVCNKTSTSNMINFTLSNSGNASAQDLVLNPVVTAATPQNETYYLSSLGPDVSHLFGVYLSNVTARGSYADYFALSYEQGPDTFTAIFMCSLDFGSVPESQLQLSTSVVQEGSIDVVNESAFNSGSSSVVANFSVIAPPSFTSGSSIAPNVSIAPNQSKSVVFDLNLPQSQQQYYQGGASVSYVSSGVHYADVEVITLSNVAQSGSSQVQQSSSLTPNKTLVISLAIVGIIAALLVRAATKRTKAAQPNVPQGQV